MTFFLFHRFPAPNKKPQALPQAAKRPGQLVRPRQGWCLSQSSFPSRDLLSHPAGSTHQAAPEANPLQHTMALLCSLQLLAIPDICVYSTTHNRVVFPGRAPSLPFSCCLPCVHYFTYIIFFFFPKKVWMLLFSAPSPCAGGNLCFGTHGKDCRNISCWS